MQQVYLLLRNNQESGPYSLEEILQLNLKPFDLVWTKGRSAAWQYPGEIEALRPYVPTTPQPEVPFKPIMTAAMEQPYARPELAAQRKEETVAAKHVYVSFPGGAPQKQRPVPMQAPENNFQGIEAKELLQKYSGEIPAQEATMKKHPIAAGNEDIDGMDLPFSPRTKKKHSLTKKDFLVTAFVLVIILAGYIIFTKTPQRYAASSGTDMAKPVVQNQVAVIPENREAEKINEAQNSVPAETTQTETVKKDKMKNPVRINRVVGRPANPTVSFTGSESEKPLPAGGSQSDNSLSAKGVTQPKNEAAGKEKKKKLGQVLKNLFGKSKAKKEAAEQDPERTAVIEEPRPAVNRQRSRRDEETTKGNETANTPAVNSSIADQIDISSNAPDNWMLGVTGLKLTVRNRSSETVKTAAVEVLYYDDNDQVLDRKLVYFNNIPPKGRITANAPDQKWADHVVLKLAAVNAKGSGLEKN